ncbi:MAG: sulfotransferase, partial [Lysobacteraceae bacterium]
HALNTLRTLLQSDPAAALHAAQQLGQDQETIAGETAFIIGAALHALDHANAAEVSLRTALLRNPAHLHAGMELAHLQRNQGRYRVAAETVDALVTATPGNGVFVLHAIVFLRECQQHAVAERIWLRAAQAGNPESSYLGGELAMALGDFKEARERFDQCLALDPIHSGAILRRAHTGPMIEPDAYSNHLERLDQQRQALPPITRIAVDFALGKLAMDRGAQAKAFAHFDRGNSEQHAIAPWDRNGWKTFLSAHASLHAHAPGNPDRGDEVVFILGLPRSGTTLLASRLGQHPQIIERGELPWLGMIDHTAITADIYLRHLRQDDAPMLRYIDKNPLNFRFLDVVARDFPRARILHCRRDPRDTAVSCYTQFFAHPDLAWTYAWDDIIAFQHDYRALVEQRPKDIAWMDIDYADLVAHPEATLRRAIDFLRMPWNDNVLEAATGGTIATASVWQARQPMHGRSVGRWRETAACTRALIAAYGNDSDPVAWA